MDANEKRRALAEIARAVSVCNDCGLARGRTRAVPGEGAPDDGQCKGRQDGSAGVVAEEAREAGPERNGRCKKTGREARARPAEDEAEEREGVAGQAGRPRRRFRERREGQRRQEERRAEGEGRPARRRQTRTSSWRGAYESAPAARARIASSAADAADSVVRHGMSRSSAVLRIATSS